MSIPNGKIIPAIPSSIICASLQHAELNTELHIFTLIQPLDQRLKHLQGRPLAGTNGEADAVAACGTWWVNRCVTVCEAICGWWYTYPSEKYELVSWDD